jgi:hypothetical protein
MGNILNAFGPDDQEDEIIINKRKKSKVKHNNPYFINTKNKTKNQQSQKNPDKKYYFQDNKSEQESHKNVPKEKKHNFQDDTPIHDIPHENTPEPHFQKHIVHDIPLEDYNEFNKYIKYKEKYLMIKKI